MFRRTTAFNEFANCNNAASNFGGGGDNFGPIGYFGSADTAAAATPESPFSTSSTFDFPPSNNINNNNNNATSDLSFVWNDHTTGGGTNLSTAPSLASFTSDNSMVWTNPNRKKAAEPDKGTAIWGDPRKQGPIKRWKVPDVPVILPPAAASSQLQPPPRVEFQTTTPSSNNTSASLDESGGDRRRRETSPDEPSSTTTSAAADQEQENEGEGDEDEEERSASTPKSKPTVNIPWVLDDHHNENSSSGLLLYSGGGANNNWTSSNGGNNNGNSNSKMESAEGISYGWGCGDLDDGDNKSNTPVPDPILFSSKSSSTNGHHNNQNHLNNNNSSNQLLQLQLAAQQQQTTTGSLGTNHVVPCHISDQLKRCVKRGLLDNWVVNEPLPPDQLEIVNHFLYYVWKLEREQNLYTQIGRSPGLFTDRAHHQREVTNLSNQMKQLVAMLTSLKQKLDVARHKQLQLMMLQQQQQTGAAAGLASVAAVVASSGQSKLNQWRYGTPSPSPYLDAQSQQVDPVVPSFVGRTGATWASSGGAVGDSATAMAWPVPVVAKNESQMLSYPNAKDSHHHHRQFLVDDDDEVGVLEDEAAVYAFVDSVTGEEGASDFEKYNSNRIRASNSATVLPPLLDDNKSSADKNSNSKQESGSGETTNSSSGGGGTTNTTAEPAPTPTPPPPPSAAASFDANVPEFVPGQPWLWRDPKELAADPDATPSTLNSKKAALTSINNYNNTVINNKSVPLGGGGTKNAAGSKSSSLMGYSSDSNGFPTSYAGIPIDSSLILPNGSGGGGYLPSLSSSSAATTARAFSSAWSRPMQQPSLYSAGPILQQQQQQQHSASSYYVPPLQLSSSSSHHHHHSVLPASSTTSGIAAASRVPYLAMKLGAPAAQAAPAPAQPASAAAAAYLMAYNNAAYPMQWVVLSNLNMVDETTLQLTLSRIASVGSCINMPGIGFAAVKFKNVSLDTILPRLHAEMLSLGVSVKLAKDEEITMLLQAVNGS